MENTREREIGRERHDKNDLFWQERPQKKKIWIIFHRMSWVYVFWVGRWGERKNDIITYHTEKYRAFQNSHIQTLKCLKKHKGQEIGRLFAVNDPGYT